MTNLKSPSNSVQHNFLKLQEQDIFETKSRVTAVSKDVKKQDRQLNLLTSHALKQMSDNKPKSTTNSVYSNIAKHKLM